MQVWEFESDIDEIKTVEDLIYYIRLKLGEYNAIEPHLYRPRRITRPLSKKALCELIRLIIDIENYERDMRKILPKF